jgi:Sigma-70 region 2
VGAPDNRSFVAGIAARYGPRLRRFLSVRLRNAADVPDLAQEVFLRLLRVNGYESIRSPEAYLFTIASHVIHQHAMRRSSEPVSVDVAEVFSELRCSRIYPHASQRRWFCIVSQVIQCRRLPMNWAYRVKPPKNISPVPSSTAEIFEPIKTP